MRRKRTIFIIAASVLLVAASIALAVFLRKRAAPEPARLLPDADAFIYVNLKPLRQAGVIGQKAPIAEPEYAQFVQETGFQFERDLDEAAFAVHLPERAPEDGARTGPPETHARFSEIFVGHFDTNRVATYFRKIAARTEQYREIEIFSFPLEGRTVRLALLGVGTAAVSNTDDPRVIRTMIDKYKEIALPFGGPALVKDYYKHVPLGTLAWSVARVSPSAPGKQSGLFILPGGYDLFFPGGSVIVASVRYTTGVHVKAEAFTTGEDAARRIADQANAFLNIFRGLQQSMQVQGPDPDVKEFFDSLKVEQNGDRAVLTASVPQGFIRKMLQEPPIGEAPLVQGNPKDEGEREAAKPGKKQQRKH